jgi:trehalose/maltose hydrolase-like predicted phosphorylase
MSAGGRDAGLGARCPRLREIVNPRRRRLLPEDVYPADPWRIVERRFTPQLLPQTETIFCTANGYLGMRATPEEGAPLHERGTYLNGFYETWPIPYGEEAYGFAKTGQTMLVVPDGTLLKLYVDDEPFELASARLLSFERVLSLREGTLVREICFETPEGKQVAVRSRRLVSLENRHLACIVYEARMLRGRASLVISSELVAPGSQPSPSGDPRRGLGLNGQPLVPSGRRARGRRVLFNLETRASGLRMACAMDHLLDGDGPVTVEDAECAEDRGRVVFLQEADEGQGMRIVKLLAYHHSATADPGELRFRTNRTLDRALREGFEGTLAAHRRRVEAFWESADVEIDGEPEVQERAPEAYAELVQAESLDCSEVDAWRRAADRTYIPYDEKAGVHLQDDGFLDRELWDFESTPPERYPLLLHYHPLVIYRHQVIKQADLVLATFLLGEHFRDEEKRRIFDYYDPLTTGDSSLSVCIQSIMASELGYHDRAYRYFADAVAMDLGDIGGNVRDGLHVAALAGTWMALVYGFAGLRDRGGRLRFRPRLPDGWTRLRFRLRVREALLEVDVRPERTDYRLLGGSALEIQDGERAIELRRDAVASVARA